VEELFNRATWIGEPSFMQRNDVFYHYYYSVESNSNEYSSELMRLRSPSFATPSFFAFGRKFESVFLQIKGEFWGSYRDQVGDYQSDLVSLSGVLPNTPFGEVGFEVFYAHFQRSAYIGSYPIDTGGGSVVVDFYEEWIYRDGLGARFTHYGEDYNLTSGFVYASADRLVPLFLEFKKLLGGTSITFRQAAFWGSTLLPPKVSVTVDRELVMGRSSLLLRANAGFFARPSDVFSLQRSPILDLRARYMRFGPSGEMTLLARGYMTENNGRELGGEVSISYRLAKPLRPAFLLGFIYAGPERGPYVGFELKRGIGSLKLGYYHAHRSLYLGVRLSHGVFAL